MARPEHPGVIRGDRKRCLLLFVLLAGLGLAALQWFYPWLEGFAARAHCAEIGGHNGSIVLLATVFIGITASFFLFTLWLAYFSGKVLRSGQAPPPGTRVCVDTVPVTGRRARTRAYIGLATPLLGLALLCWGILTFRELRDDMIAPSLEKLRASCLADGAAGQAAPAQTPVPLAD